MQAPLDKPEKNGKVQKPTSPYELMRAIVAWVSKRGWDGNVGRNLGSDKSVLSAANHWGLKKATVYRYLKVATHSSPTVATAFKAGELSFSHAYELSKHNKAIQEDYLFIAKRVSVRQLRMAIANGDSELYLAASEEKRPELSSDPNIKALLSYMDEALRIGEACDIYRGDNDYVLSISYTGIDKVPNILWRTQAADSTGKVDVVTDRYDMALKVAIGRVYLRFPTYKRLMEHLTLIASNKFTGIPGYDPVSFFQLDWMYRGWNPGQYGLKSARHTGVL